LRSKSFRFSVHGASLWHCLSFVHLWAQSCLCLWDRIFRPSTHGAFLWRSLGFVHLWAQSCCCLWDRDSVVALLSNRPATNLNHGRRCRRFLRRHSRG
jgi:hypothetical protein